MRVRRFVSFYECSPIVISWYESARGCHLCELEMHDGWGDVLKHSPPDIQQIRHMLVYPVHYAPALDNLPRPIGVKHDY